MRKKGLRGLFLAGVVAAMFSGCGETSVVTISDAQEAKEAPLRVSVSRGIWRQSTRKRIFWRTEQSRAGWRSRDLSTRNGRSRWAAKRGFI